MDGPTSIFVGDPADGSLDDHQITHGVRYEWWEEDRGTYMAYDRGERRAYYHHHTR
jgi:hypothetical protein